MAKEARQAAWAQLRNGSTIRTEQIALITGTVTNAAFMRMRRSGKEAAGRSGKSCLWKVSDVVEVYPELAAEGAA